MSDIWNLMADAKKWHHHDELLNPTKHICSGICCNGSVYNYLNRLKYLHWIEIEAHWRNISPNELYIIWLQNYVQDQFGVYVRDKGRIRFYFKSKKDAVMFKLRFT